MSAQKSGLHPRNRHQHRYDLAALCQTTSELTSFLIRTPAGEQSVDFANPQAVKALNKALLAHFYAVTHWDIPPGFLCPPVPGRADYIHHLADLLGETTGSIPAQATILDVGVGANCIYPLIGVHEYGWRFTGSEVSDAAMSSAQAIIQANTGLSRAIRLRRQKIRRPFLPVSFIKMNFMTQRFVTRLFTTPPPQPARAASVSAAIWGRIKMMR